MLLLPSYSTHTNICAVQIAGKFPFWPKLGSNQKLGSKKSPKLIMKRREKRKKMG